jgi:hypothetical protein
MNGLSRKTLLAVVSVVFTVVVFVAILAMFLVDLWNSDENPLGKDGVGPNNRLIESTRDPEMGLRGKD